MKKIGECPGYGNQNGEESHDAGSSRQLEKRHIHKKPHYYQENERYENTQDRRKMMAAENTFYEFPTVMRNVPYFLNRKRSIQIPFHFDEPAFAQFNFIVPEL